MLESKNTFLGGKMEKDLDDRLIEGNVYRDARNITVSTSAGSDVGLVQSVKGNINATNLGLTSAYKIIGRYEDKQENRIFLFTTDGTVNHSVSVYDVDADTHTVLVNGSFLGFSKSNLITGISLIEDMLGWVEEGNQPRVINVATALASPGYYDTETKISLAKYAPVYPPLISGVSRDPSILSNNLEDKFVRFSYRYKFKDGQYSVLAPFSPTAFKMENNEIVSEEDIYAAAEVDFMINFINTVTLQLPVPTATPDDDIDIEMVEILYKEAGSPAVQIIDRVDVATATIANKDFDIDGVAEQPSIEYIYKSKKPIATLPERELTRVWDRVPIAAKALTSVGNRFVIGNYKEGGVAPVLDYTVTYSPKSSELVTAVPVLENQTVKSRRTLQVGIVLSDIFGRSTPVILSESSSVTVEAKGSTFDNSTWDGDSLKLIFLDVIPNSYDAVSNPLGWYSFKVVIKQPEQEYYNVYTGGAINYGPGSLKSYIQLFGGSVNKVPRDTNASSAIDSVVASQERLFPKVVNTGFSTQEQSNGALLDVIGIGTEDDFNTADAFWKMYDSSSKPLLASLSRLLGVERFTFNPLLAVFETAPFESSLDIYYETSTSGLVSQINDNINDVILDNWSVNDASISTAIGNVSESTAPGTYIATLYAFNDAVTFEQMEGAIFTLDAGGAVGGNQRYTVELDPGDGKYKVKLNQGFVFDSGDNARGLFVTGTFGNTSIQKTLTISETNTAPTISGVTTSFVDVDEPVGTPSGGGVSGGIIAKPTAVNGSGSNSNKTGLTFSIVSATHNGSNVASNFGIVSNYDELVSTPGTATVYIASSLSGLSAAFDVAMVIRVTDSAGATDDLNLTIELSAGAVSDPLSYYFAPFSTFSTVEQACAAGVGDPRWNAVTVYAIPGENPIATNNSSQDIYFDSSRTTGAKSGWYRDLSNGAGQWVVGSPGGWTQLDNCTQ